MLNYKVKPETMIMTGLVMVIKSIHSDFVKGKLLSIHTMLKQLF